MTVTIELDEATAAVLAPKAASRGMTLAEYATGLVVADASPPARQPAPEHLFRTAMAGSIRDHEEVYRRLAK